MGDGHSAIDGEGKLTLSPQHKMLISHFAYDLLFDEDEIFCSAKHMLGNTVTRNAQKKVNYIHLMLEHHQAIAANDVETESYHAGPESQNTLSDTSKADETMLLSEEIALSKAWQKERRTA